MGSRTKEKSMKPVKLSEEKRWYIEQVVKHLLLAEESAAKACEVDLGQEIRELTTIARKAWHHPNK